MKNKIFILALLLASAGCVQEEIVETKRFRAVTEGVDTKVSLGERNTVLWSKSDHVAVFEDNELAGKYKVSDASDGEQKADFVMVEASDNRGSLGANLALYPYSSGLTASQKASNAYLVKGVTLPQVQQYAEGTFFKESFLMTAAADADKSEFSFRNACGLLKLQLSGDITVSSIQLKGNASEILAGTADITIYNDVRTPSIEMLEENASTTVVLDCGAEGVRLSPDEPKPFYIVLPPTAFASGFQITVVDVNNGKMILNTSKANPVKRSGILTMPEVKVNSADMDVPVHAEMQVVSTSFDDVKIKVSVTGAVEYTGGYKLKEEYNVSNVLREANWKTSPRVSDNFTYEGSLKSFPAGGSGVLMPGRSYVIWLGAYGKTVKSLKAEDLVTVEVAVPAVTPGGTVSAEVKDVRADFNSVEVDIHADGASMIFAAMLTQNEMMAKGSDGDKISYLLNKVAPVSGEMATVTRTGIPSGEEVTLIAMAVDAQGHYGNLLEGSYSPAVPKFDDSAVLTADIGCEARTMKVKPVVSNGDFQHYYYLVEKSVSSAWTRILGGSLASAEAFVTTNPDHYLIKNTVDVPMVDGAIVIDGIEIGEEYKILLIGQKADGTYSRAFMAVFTPEVDLGNFIYNTGDTKGLWLASQPMVTFGTCVKDGEFAIINWSVMPAEGMTAYSACLTSALAEDCTPEELVIRIFNNGTKVIPDKMETMLYGDDTSAVYVTWCDAEGNFYEPAMFVVP